MSDLTIDNIQKLADILTKIDDYTKAVHDIALDMAKEVREYENTMTELMKGIRDEL